MSVCGRFRGAHHSVGPPLDFLDNSVPVRMRRLRGLYATIRGESCAAEFTE